MKILERYREIVEDWDAFEQALRTPLPYSFWVNPLKIDEKSFREFFEQRALPLEPLSWRKGAFRTAFQGGGFGRFWEYIIGLFHIQEEASMLPAFLLAPEPGQRVLDMCAAPGGKALQLAVAMEQKGTLVANDRSLGRLRLIRKHLARLGVRNMTLTAVDAASYPSDAGFFDRVLVDAPCSCLGTSRRDPEVLVRWSNHSYSKELQKRQIAILRRGIQLCKPGGRIVYSTCTYAPEENEAVVQAMFDSFPAGTFEVEEVKLSGFRFAEGIETWEGQLFDPSIRKTMRVWPHLNDTGGFYIAVLKKLRWRNQWTEGFSKRVPVLSEWKSLDTSLGHFYSAEEKEEVFEDLCERFGLDASFFQQTDLVKLGNRRLYWLPSDHEPPNQPIFDGSGILLLNVGANCSKLSTEASMLLGKSASRHIIELSAEQRDLYLRRETLKLEEEQLSFCSSIGFVIMRYQGLVLGVGLYMPQDDSSALIKCLFPKAWSRDFLS